MDHLYSIHQPLFFIGWFLFEFQGGTGGGGIYQRLSIVADLTHEC